MTTRFTIEALESGFKTRRGQRGSFATNVEVRIYQGRRRGLEKDMDMFFYITPTQARQLAEEIADALRRIDKDAAP